MNQLISKIVIEKLKNILKKYTNMNTIKKLINNLSIINKNWYFN